MTEVIEGQRTFTVEEYHRMGEAGVFGPDERVELIWGVIREMSPKGRRHSVAVGLATNLFVRRLEGRAGVQIQDAITLAGIRSEPEPDIVVNSSPDLRKLRTEKSRPLLVIEVSDSSLRFDRDQKAQLYAKGRYPRVLDREPRERCPRGVSRSERRRLPDNARREAYRYSHTPFVVRPRDRGKRPHPLKQAS